MGVIYPPPQQGNGGGSVGWSFLHLGCSRAADAAAPSPFAAGADTFALLAELSAGLEEQGCCRYGNSNQK